jgi:protein O-mannosyl-transferase
MQPPRDRKSRGPARPGSRLKPLGYLILLVLLTAAAYSNSFQAAWHFDDHANILQNVYVHLASLRPSALGRAMVQNGRQNRPFSNLTFALNYYFNTERPWGYHLVNLALHLLAAAAGFQALRRTFRRAGLPEDRSDLAAFAALALWAVHPLHTQAVTYVVQRQAVMASALMLVSLALYIAARENPIRRQRLLLYALVLASSLLAVGSKEIALATPIIILLYELYFFQKLSFDFLRRHAVALAAGIVALAILLTLYFRPEMIRYLINEAEGYPFTLTERLLTQPRILCQYLGLILWPLPSRLSLEHDPELSTSLFHPWTTFPALLGWLLLVVAAVRSARRHPWLSFAALWFVLNLVLESSVLPLDLMMEHRLYLPSLALLVPLASAPIFFLPRRTAVALVMTIACFFLLGTLARNRVWQTDLGLWKDCVRKAPDQPRPWLNLGTVYNNLGDKKRALADINHGIILMTAP